MIKVPFVIALGLLALGCGSSQKSAPEVTADLSELSEDEAVEAAGFFGYHDGTGQDPTIRELVKDVFSFESTFNELMNEYSELDPKAMASHYEPELFVVSMSILQLDLQMNFGVSEKGLEAIAARASNETKEPAEFISSKWIEKRRAVLLAVHDSIEEIKRFVNLCFELEVQFDSVGLESFRDDEANDAYFAAIENLNEKIMDTSEKKEQYYEFIRAVMPVLSPVEGKLL